MELIEILPHPLRGTMEIGSERIMPVFGKIRAADGASDEKPVLTVVGTDGSEDRHGSVINPRGWDVTAFKRNPVGLWQHGQVPEYPYVAKALALRNVGGAWDFDMELLVGLWRHMANNMAAFLWEAYRDFDMGAVSISFIPKEWKEREASTIPTFFAENVEYTRQELTEISFVNVPSNRNALAKVFERRRAAGTASDDLARMLGYAVSPIIIRTQPEDLYKTTAPISAEVLAKVGRGEQLTEAELEECQAFTDSVKELTSLGAEPRSLEAFREKAEEILRCCGCDVYRPPQPEPISEEAKAVEIELMTEVVDSLILTFERAIEAWKMTAQEEIRGVFSGIAVSALYSAESLMYRAHDWYGVNLGVPAIPEIAWDDVEQAVSNAAPDFTRVGKVFSAKNLAKIDQIIGLATELRAAHNDATQGDEEIEDEERATPAWPDGLLVIRDFPGQVGDVKFNIRIKDTGDAPREHDANSQPFRVLAPDTADRGNGAQSTPQATDVITLILADE